MEDILGLLVAMTMAFMLSKAVAEFFGGSFGELLEVIVLIAGSIFLWSVFRS